MLDNVRERIKAMNKKCIQISLVHFPSMMDREERHRLWLTFLQRANAETATADALCEYFLRQISASPDRLCDFIRFLEKHCQRSRKTEERRWIARQYLSILSPLCERFGLFEEKERMDSFCFRMTEPEEYARLTALLSRYRSRSRHVVRRISTILRALLDGTGHTYELQGRYKSLYSVQRKQQTRTRHGSPLQLTDIFAFRIIIATDDDDDCFAVMNTLHDHFHPIPGKFKDYITVPKMNGYQSIHTILNGVIPDLDLPVEFQVRTRAMHDFAERGVASHWIYARNEQLQQTTRRERQLLIHFASVSEEARRRELVFCLTPKGDVLRMPAGCTILDIAYRIHTDIGNRASGALINDKPCSVHCPVHDGDRVQVLTAPSAQVHDEWLQSAKLSHTRRKIHAHTRS